MSHDKETTCERCEQLFLFNEGFYVTQGNKTVVWCSRCENLRIRRAKKKAALLRAAQPKAVVRPSHAPRKYVKSTRAKRRW